MSYNMFLLFIDERFILKERFLEMFFFSSDFLKPFYSKDV